MATETLRPNAAGDKTELTPVGGDANWECVDEASPDENATKVETASSGSLEDLYNIPNHSVGSGSINHITVYIRGRRLTTYGYGYCGIKSGTTEVYGNQNYFEALDWTTYSYQWATDPNTGSPWTWAAIDALQIGVKLYSGAVAWKHCTQVYVVVDYSVAAPTVTTQAASSVLSTSCTGNGNITATGGENCTVRGFCYKTGTTGDPTTADSTASDSGSYSTGAYTKSITGLSQLTSYRVRAYATNTAGTGYGTTVQVRTTGARELTTAIGLSPTITRATTHARALTAQVGLQASLETDGKNLSAYLCVASRDGGSVKTRDGTTWSVCATDDGSASLLGAHFAQFDNRLCVIRYQNIGFAYSPVNDIVNNWTDKPNFPNLPQVFTDLFVGRDAGDDPALYFLTPTGMYYLDVFSNFVFGPTELSWEYDLISGKKGLYGRGGTYVAIGKGIYNVNKGVVTLIGPDQDDGLPEDLQGSITDMIQVGFWLVIAVDGGNNKSSILKRYITGKHWHPVYVGSIDTPIRALMWDSGTLYFGEGSNVKSLPFSNKTENVAKLSTHTYSASGDLIYPYFHSEFEAMPKVAHKVRGVTQDCDSNDTITISYRTDSTTAWTELGSFVTSPRPTALPFPASGDAVGTSFERIQFKASYARTTSTDSPKVESLTLEYRVVPPVLWGWDFKVKAVSQGDKSGQDIIDDLKTAIETGTLMSFYPDGDKGGTEYFVEVSQMPGLESGTEFGQEGIYVVSVNEVID